MHNLTVKAKIGLLSMLSIVLLLIVGGAGALGVTRVGGAMSQLGQTHLPSVIALSNVRSYQYALYAYTLEAATWEKEKYANSQFKEILARKQKATAAFDAAIKAYAAQPREAAEDKAWKVLEPQLKRWREYDGKLNTVIEALGDNTEFEQQAELFEKFYFHVTDWKDAQYAVEKNLATLVELNVRGAHDASETGARASKASITVMILVAAIAVAVLLSLGWFFFRSITRPLEAMRQAITRVATENDFTIRANVTSNDEAGQTARAFNQLVDQMQASLREVLSAAESITAASASASSAAERVSLSSDSQSESAAAMASAIEEMTVSINHITESSRDALRRAHDAGGAADNGATAIRQANTEMDAISGTVQIAGGSINDLGQQTEKIGAIMLVIKEVADQTNLLALNAAIEAARAGEQGRGFAVVADEVRKLAERTRRATDEINQMVERMQTAARSAVSGMDTVVNRVVDGKALSDQAAGRMDAIQQNASEVTSAVNEISAALQEQSAAAHDIARQVEQVAQMSEDNSVAARSTAQIASELDAFAGTLRDIAGRFRV